MLSCSCGHMAIRLMRWALWLYAVCLSDLLFFVVLCPSHWDLSLCDLCALPSVDALDFVVV